jgi:hypothetical protein
MPFLEKKILDKQLKAVGRHNEQAWREHWISPSPSGKGRVSARQGWVGEKVPEPRHKSYEGIKSLQDANPSCGGRGKRASLEGALRLFAA